MAFQRDLGTCCFVLPLKLGVGITTMVAFINSIVCILALLTDDIRFQANGYNLTLYHLPSAVGSLGLLVGFIGLLGVYDDKPMLLKVFNWWLSLKIVAQLVTAIADYWTLWKCDSWLNSTEHLSAHNTQLDALAEQGVCPWARWAYILGAGLDIGFWFFLAVRSFSYQWQVELNPPYAIDFGREQYDKEARWKLFQVKSPQREEKGRRTAFDTTTDHNDASYGSMTDQNAELPDVEQEIQPSYTYAPNGQRVVRRPAAGFSSDQPTHYPDGSRIGMGPGGFTPAPRNSEMVPL
mmetsp:Transcript_115584/g.338112  ORF Transcript_115584/g.338112 Transcript_115584/m.338112 type:complete len:293 (+) Transcript_115584:128-1006(+)